MTSRALAIATASSNGPDEPGCPACAGRLGTPLIVSPDRLGNLAGPFSVACCKACGMGVTLPVVDASQLASLYPTNYGTHERLPRGALGLVSRAVQRLQARQSLRSEPLQRLATVPAGRLLDVGCGRGDLGSWFVRRSWSVVGVEPSAQACAVARNRGIDARVGTLADIALEPREYDAVVFRHSLEHVTDPVGDLRRAREALRDDGVVVVSVPNFGGWQSHRFRESWFHLDLPRHRFHFNAQALRLTLAQAGFQRVETSTSSIYVGLPGSIQYALAGRWLFPQGLATHATVALCTVFKPVTSFLDRLYGDGDVLHAVGYAG